MRAERVSRQQLQSKLREQGYSSIEPINAIVMETSGRLAILRSADSDVDLLDGVPAP